MAGETTRNKPLDTLADLVSPGADSTELSAIISNAASGVQTPETKILSNLIYAGASSTALATSMTEILAGTSNNAGRRLSDLISPGASAATLATILGGSIPPAGLQTLTLSSSSFTQGADAGTVIGAIGAKTSGSRIEIRSASGRVVPDATFSNLVVGLTASSSGSFSITLREVHPTLGTKDTPFTITVGSLAALGPMSTAQAPVAIYAFSKINPAYAGNCFQVRDSTNTLRTIGFNGDGTLNTTGMSGFGDGISFTVATWYDQSGNTRDTTSSSRPPLFFPGNFATLVNTPSITAAGTGYTVGDVLTPTGGIIADSGGLTAQVTVATVSSGAITGITVTRAGKYKHSPSPTGNATGVTGGTGSGATFVWALTGDAGNVYNTVPSIDYTAATLNLTTASTFLNVGGTANLSVFVVAARYGYGNQYSPRPGTPTTSAHSCMLGYGTLSTGILMGATPVAATSTNAQVFTFDPTRDSLGRSASAYGRPEWLSMDEAAPAVGTPFTNLWFNQSGATVSGGGDTRKHFSNREHGITAANSQRLVIGATGLQGASANGAIKEVIIYQYTTTPMSDTEAQRVAIDQQSRHSTSNTTYAPRYFVPFVGQSNANNQLATSSGDNTAGTDSATRRWLPKISSYTGITTDRISYGMASRTAVGGTAMMKRGMPGDAPRLLYWWDEDTNGPGTLAIGQSLATPSVTVGGTGYTLNDILTVVGGTLTSGGTVTTLQVTGVTGGVINQVTLVNPGSYSSVPTSPFTVTGGTGSGATISATWAGGILPYFDSIMQGIKYKQLLLIHAQGEEDSKSTNMDDARMLQWAQQSYLYLDYIRTYLGQPNAPILIQPLARYGGGSGYVYRVNTMRRYQSSYLALQRNVFLAPDTGFLARDTVTYDAHFGSLVQYDNTTGGPEDGYQRLSWQNAKASANALRCVYGADVIANDNWRGPEVVSAAVSGSTTIDLTIGYPYGCAGTDISTPSGQYGGFRAFTSGGDLTISSTSKVSATTMRVTLSAPVPAGTSVTYEPNFSSGSALGANVINQLIDNNAELGLPVATSPVFAVS
jgi:hypothetical protein